MKRRVQHPWDMDALRRAVAAASSWKDAAARYTAATGQPRTAHLVNMRANKASIPRPFATAGDRRWDFVAMRAAALAASRWRPAAAAYNAATGQARSVKHFHVECRRLGIKLGVQTGPRCHEDALRAALARGKGWKEVARLYREATGKACDVNGVQGMAYRRGLGLAARSRRVIALPYVPKRNPLCRLLADSADRLEEKERTR